MTGEATRPLAEDAHIFLPGAVMAIEVGAIYENGVLKLDRLLPLQERERVTVIVKARAGRVRRSAGLIPWTGDQKALEDLLGPENHPWSE